MIGGLEVAECLGEAGFLEIVAELGIDVILVFRVPCGDGLGYLA